MDAFPEGWERGEPVRQLCLGGRRARDASFDRRQRMEEARSERGRGVASVLKNTLAPHPFIFFPYGEPRSGEPEGLKCARKWASRAQNMPHVRTAASPARGHSKVTILGDAESNLPPSVVVRCQMMGIVG